ncbi:methytransferase partner Trm112 [Chloroflexota bacterium]
MKRELMDILACPQCKGNLELEANKEEGGEVVSGSITCAACHQSYPINDGIPNLLPPE